VTTKARARSTRAKSKGNHRGQVTGMTGLIHQLEECCAQHGERIAMKHLLQAVGRRSFGPFLLLLGLIGLAPISNIPGVVAVVVALDILVIGEILIGMDHIWIPRFLARRTIATSKLKRGLKALRKPAKFVDRFVEPRLAWLTQGPALYALAVVCMMVALALPFIEIIPFAGIVPNAALVCFGLAFTAHDGLWAILGLIIVGVSGYLLAMAIG
jgi:hypothetical protein